MSVPAPDLVQLAYVSSTQPKLTLEEIEQLLVKSRRNNQRLGITGVLLYRDGNVLQVLEGPAETVDKLFNVISRDPRHRRVLKMYRKPAAVRDFSEWEMGFRELGAEQLRALPGFSDILDPNFDISTIKSAYAAAFVEAFKNSIR